MESAALVAMGAVGGALTRWHLTSRASPPWQMVMAINVAGSFTLGAISGYCAGARPRVILLAGTGYLGSLTTFSAFSLDTITLLETGQIGKACIVALGTPAMGIGAAALGLAAGRRMAALR